MDQQSIFILSGYLHALRRLSCNKCDFWVEVFDLKNDLESCFKEQMSGKGVNVVSSTFAGHKKIEETLDSHLCNKISLDNKDILKLFAWDIFEYLEMSFQSIEPVVNPIYNEECLVINANSEFHGDYVYVLVPVRKEVVAIGLATRS